MPDNNLSANINGFNSGRAKRLLIVSLLTFLGLGMSMVSTGGLCQTNCTPLTGDEPRWANGTNVYIVRGPGWTDSMWDGFVVALENWNQSNAQNEILVSFDYTHAPPNSNSPQILADWGSIPNNNGSQAAAIIHRTFSSFGYLTSAHIRFDSSILVGNSAGQMVQAISTPQGVTKATRHEIGHTMGLGESQSNPQIPNSNSECMGGQVSGSTIMNSACGPNDEGNNQPSGITPCDQQRAGTRMNGSPGGGPAPTPTPTPGPVLGCNPFERQECLNLETWRWNEDTCQCYCDDGFGCFTPILLDEDGDGVHVTPRKHGVYFDLNSDGFRELIGWTGENSDDRWLARDINHNGIIDDGTELFGNFSPQSSPPDGEQKNGFLALAEFDKPGNGGNGDGKFTWHDREFHGLLLWQDLNHNGISESAELTRLSDFRLPGATSFPEISLNYKVAGRRGYRARISDENAPHKFRWLLDIFLER